LVGGTAREFRELGVGGEAQADDLFDREAGIEQLSGEREMAQVFFRADGAILGFEGKSPGEKEKQQQCHGDQHDQFGAETPDVAGTRESPVQIDQRTDERNEDYAKQNVMVERHELRVLCVALFFHGWGLLWPVR